jgi:acetyl-CoA acyltransferase
MSDGAGAVLLVSEKALKEFNLTPLARFVGFAVARRAARDHGHRPGRGDPARAEAGRHHAGRLDWIELNEAFAAQALAVIRTWA